jgi:V8-like Glu-specific endopeptidase
MLLCLDACHHSRLGNEYVMRKNFDFTIPWRFAEKPLVQIGPTDDRQYVFTINMPPKCYRSICRIELEDPSRAGTGFLVAPNWMLTCNHVLRSPEEASAAQITVGLVRIWSFGFLRVARTRPTKFVANPAQGFCFSPKPVDRNPPDSDHLDYTLVFVEPQLGHTAQPHFLPVSELDASVNQAVKVFQFPNQSMQVASGKVTGISAPFFFHNADTEGGASGSPVVGLDGRVVGMHSHGCYTPETNRGTCLGAVFQDVCQNTHEVWRHIADQQDWFVG